MDNLIRKNSFRAWLLAARPKTLTGAAVPVMIGSALAVSDAQWQVRWVPMALCFLFAFIMQIDANFINDYFDFKKGTDDELRLGPKRACAQGWVTTEAMKRAIAIVTLLACAVGLPLVVYGGWKMVVVGAFCVVFCFLYTTHLSYVGMGDVLVVLFFGIVPVTMTYYLVMPEPMQAVTKECLLLSVLCGLVVDTLLVVNNVRDIDNDRRTGKRTLIVVMGRRKGQLFYLFLGLAATFSGLLLHLFGHFWAAWLPVVFFQPFHMAAFVEMWNIKQGAELNRILGITARNIFLYGLALSLGLLLPNP